MKYADTRPYADPEKAARRLLEITRTVDRTGRALDHENRNIPISKPAANAQRPNVQAEITRTRLRRSSSDAISWDRSVMQLPPAQQFLGPSFLDGRHPGDPGHAHTGYPSQPPCRN